MIKLTDCASDLDDAPNCLAFLDAWQRWRKDDPMPSTDRIKPEELGPAMSSLSVLEAHSQDSIKFRLVSALLAEIMGEDFTGRNITSMVPEDNRQRALGRLWNVAAVPCGTILAMTYIRPSGASLMTRRLILPVAPMSSDQPTWLYFAIEVFGDRPKPYDPPESTIAVMEESTYVDIGYGAPE
ncbi:MAG: PAS domain-containing protein [Alphaproteobacteria bacterium]|nr:PAS domain-containing protein [Alphaproteobacteria bacterium]